MGAVGSWMREEGCELGMDGVDASGWLPLMAGLVNGDECCAWVGEGAGCVSWDTGRLVGEGRRRTDKKGSHYTLQANARGSLVLWPVLDV